MTVTTKTLTGKLSSIIGGVFSDWTKVYAFIEWNLDEGQAAVDADNNKILLGTRPLTLDSVGAFSVAGLVTGGVQPTGIQYRVRWEYPDNLAKKGRANGDSGWFELTSTGTIDLADVMIVDYVPPSWMTDAIAILQVYVDEAEAAAQSAGINDIGTITTGAPGTPADASITGTPPTRLLNLTIPSGLPGDFIENFTGPWDSGTAYVEGQIVTSGGSSWIALANNTNVTPVEGATWTTVAAKGIDGEDGAPNDLSIGTVTTSAPGSDAEVEVTGDSPAQVINFVLPRGIAGTDGEDGDDGAAATITVGTVTTGAPGTDVDVTNSGTTSAAVLDFTIPRGDAGAGSGDFTGPGSSTADNFVSFASGTGKVGKDSGKNAASFATAAQGTKADSALQAAAIGVTVQGYDSDLATIGGLTATTDNVIQSVAGSWASRTMAQLKTALALTKSDVGLGNVPNVNTTTGGGREATAALSATTGTCTADLSVASIFTITPTGNWTLAFSNVPASGTGETISIIVSEGGTPRTMTDPAGTTWADPGAPTAVASKWRILTFLSIDAATAWRAGYIKQA